MEFTKPIKEFTLEELLEGRRTLKGLIAATQEVKDSLNGPDDLLIKMLDLDLALAYLPEKPPLNFKELTEKNLNNFKHAYAFLIEELARREINPFKIMTKEEFAKDYE